jgi:hypothetical protein
MALAHFTPAELPWELAILVVGIVIGFALARRWPEREGTDRSR